ncbi:hypothetical protein BAQ_1944, partial [Bacillus anthracis str. A0193]
VNKIAIVYEMIVSFFEITAFIITYSFLLITFIM